MDVGVQSCLVVGESAAFAIDVGGSALLAYIIIIDELKVLFAD